MPHLNSPAKTPATVVDLPKFSQDSLATDSGRYPKTPERTHASDGAQLISIGTLAEVKLTLSRSGSAYLSLGSAEVRDSVPLDAIDEADSVPALAAIVLDFDHYGRLVGINVLHSAESALPPTLLDKAERA